jgi:hypothetical protein
VQQQLCHPAVCRDEDVDDTLIAGVDLPCHTPGTAVGLHKLIRTLLEDFQHPLFYFRHTTCAVLALPCDHLRTQALVAFRRTWDGHWCTEGCNAEATRLRQYNQPSSLWRLQFMAYRAALRYRAANGSSNSSITSFTTTPTLPPQPHLEAHAARAVHRGKQCKLVIKPAESLIHGLTVQINLWQVQTGRGRGGRAGGRVGEICPGEVCEGLNWGVVMYGD